MCICDQRWNVKVVIVSFNILIGFRLNKYSVSDSVIRVLCQDKQKTSVAIPCLSITHSSSIYLITAIRMKWMAFLIVFVLLFFPFSSSSFFMCIQKDSPSKKRKWWNARKWSRNICKIVEVPCVCRTVWFQRKTAYSRWSQIDNVCLFHSTLTCTFEFSFEGHSKANHRSHCARLRFRRSTNKSVTSKKLLIDAG